MLGHMRYSPAGVAGAAREIAERLGGAWVQRIYQGCEGHVLLHLYSSSLGEQRLVLDVRPGHQAIGLLPREAQVPHPVDPPPFCMLLRKHVLGRRLDQAEAVPGERLILLRFGRAGTERPRVDLAVELTGRSGNVVLVVDGQVAGHLRTPGEARGLRIHEPYVLPPAPPIDPAPRRDAQAGDALPLAEAGKAWHQAYLREHLDALRRPLLRTLGEWLRRIERRVARQEQDRAEAGKADDLRAAGELLLAYASRVAPGSTSTRLPPEGEEEAAGFQPVEITLDPALSAVENAQALFRRYRKARRAAEVLAERVEKGRQRMEAARLVEVLAREAEDPQTLEALAEEAEAIVREDAREASEQPAGTTGHRDVGGQGRQGRTRQDTRRADAGEGARHGPVLRLRASTGAEILAGKSASANDRLTFHVARPDDWWLHARQIAGAHVVLRQHGGDTPDQRALLEAAAVAARLSAQGRAGVAVAVDYTRRRHVRKPPGAPPGFVLYDRERTLLVIPDRESLPPAFNAESAGPG